MTQWHEFIWTIVFIRGPARAIILEREFHAQDVDRFQSDTETSNNAQIRDANSFPYPAIQTQTTHYGKDRIVAELSECLFLTQPDEGI